MIRSLSKTALAMLTLISAAQCGGCGSAPSVNSVHTDIEEAQFASAATAAFERGQIEEAESLYRGQLNRAMATDDPTSISDAEFNVALCLIRQNHPAEAAPLLLDAEAESRRAGASITDIVLLRAVAARMQGQHTEAITLTRQVLSTRATTAAQRVQAHVIAGLCQFSLGAATSAADELAKARQDAAKVNDAAILAGVAQLAGRVAESTGRPGAAARNYDEQAQLLYQAGLYSDMSDALQHAGVAYRSAGMTAAAAERLYRAARSIAAQGDPATASSLAREAAESAASSDDSALTARITALLNELPPATQTARP
jgi:hypothetical protein